MNTGMAIEEGTAEGDVTTWNGMFYGLNCRIVRWIGFENDVIWNYYVDVPESQMTGLMRGLLNGYEDMDEFASRYFSDCGWHGEITYTAMAESTDGKVLVVGCDYNHLSDKATSYNFLMIRDDLAATASNVASRLLN